MLGSQIDLGPDAVLRDLLSPGRDRRAPHWGRSAYPRAADDFPAIRTRMEELRRERAGVPADDDLRRAEGLRPYSGSRQPSTGNKMGFPLAIRRAFLKVRTG